jgi:hypothetical protein
VVLTIWICVISFALTFWWIFYKVGEAYHESYLTNRVTIDLTKKVNKTVKEVEAVKKEQTKVKGIVFDKAAKNHNLIEKHLKEIREIK